MLFSLDAKKITNRCPRASPELATRLPTPRSQGSYNARTRLPAPRTACSLHASICGNGGQVHGNGGQVAWHCIQPKRWHPPAIACLSSPRNLTQPWQWRAGPPANA
jgi:hypothetical protein